MKRTMLVLVLGAFAVVCDRSRAPHASRRDAEKEAPAGAKVSKDMPTREKPSKDMFLMLKQHYYMEPLDEPRWVAASRADYMRPDDTVLGLQMGDGAWALPWWVMKNHHVANLVDPGPVLITFCDSCSSGGAFDPVFGGQRLRFRLHGAYKGTIMIQDEVTGSLWTGFTGESIQGPRKGAMMARLPLVHCRWDEWLAAHPGTLVVDGMNESREGHGSKKHPGGDKGKRQGLAGTLVHFDYRLPHNKMVLGVRVGEAARCYPLDRLQRLGRALNDSLGGREIVVFSKAGSLMAIAFFRQLDGRTLAFRMRGEAVVDEQTGSEWDMAGRAVTGPLKGRRLEFSHSGVEEFHIWASFHPDTEILGQDPRAEGKPGPRLGHQGSDG